MGGAVGHNGIGAPLRTGRWASLRRPTGLIGQTRWLFCLGVLVSLGLTLPGAVLGATSSTLPPVLAAMIALIALWVVRYATCRATWLRDLAEAAAVTVLAMVGTDPSAVFQFVFPALWFRALYGSTRRVMLFCSAVAVGLIAALPLWGLVSDHDGAVPVAVVLSSVSGMFLTAGIARYLAVSLFARDQSQRRDAALAQLGQELLGETDRAVIRTRARECARALCTATPGLTALIVQGAPDGLVVLDHVGALERAPATLPRSAVPVGSDPDEVHRVSDPEALRGAGPAVAWVAMAVADLVDGWILLGAPGRVTGDTVVAVRSLTNLVALAMRTSDAHQDLATQASHDSLTGLANRAAFTAALQTALAEPDRRPALLFVDLDDFKTVNDGLGHAAGDELLRQIATRLRWSVRSGDLCARLGGDEFAVLLADAGDDAVIRAQRLVDLVAAPVSLRGRLAAVGASVGLAFATATATATTRTGLDELLQQADIAMYAAKAKGKNRVQVFDPHLLRKDHRSVFEAEVAAADRAGELVVHYQPIVRVDDGACVAVEALVRWRHPRRGLLAPAEFITTAEATGAIIGIGAFVLGRACADASAWTGPAGPLAIHVNVSAAQLTDPAFFDTVRDCIRTHRLEPKRLVLEVTEGMVLDSPMIRLALDHLVDLGVAVAVDDFGTGYSALSTIRSLPLDIVKLDKSFLSASPPSPADEVVVRAVVQMARQLGLKVVAEGVERAAQQQFLESVGADAAQGYLHQRPVPANQLEHWLDAQLSPRFPRDAITLVGPRRTG